MNFIKSHIKILIIITVLSALLVSAIFVYSVYHKEKPLMTKVSEEYQANLPINWDGKFDNSKGYTILNNKENYYSEIKVFDGSFDKAKEKIDVYHVPESKLITDSSSSTKVNSKSKYVRKLKNNYEKRKETTFLNLYTYEMEESNKSFVFIIESKDETYINDIDKELDNIYLSLTRVGKN